MKIYDENQFTKSKLDEREREARLGLEDENNTNTMRVEKEFVKQILKGVKGPNKSVGDVIVKCDEKEIDDKNFTFHGIFKTLTKNTYEYSGKLRLNSTSDKDDVTADLSSSFIINTVVPPRNIERYELNKGEIEKLLKENIGKHIESTVKELKISSCSCELAYDKLYKGECKYKVHSV